MAKARPGRFRVSGYDGDYAQRDRVAGSSNHRIEVRVKTLAEAFQIMNDWLNRMPPQNNWGIHPHAEVWDDRDGYSVEKWSRDQDGQWTPMYRRAETKKFMTTNNPGRTRTSYDVAQASFENLVRQIDGLYMHEAHHRDASMRERLDHVTSILDATSTRTTHVAPEYVAGLDFYKRKKRLPRRAAVLDVLDARRSNPSCDRAQIVAQRLARGES